MPLSVEQQNPETCQNFIRVMKRRQELTSLESKIVTPSMPVLNFVTLFLMEKVGIGSP